MVTANEQLFAVGDDEADSADYGKENLHVILWAIDSNTPTEPVLNILKALDVNSRRLVHRFDAIESHTHK